MDDKSIIDLYFDRDDRAIGETAEKYGKTMHSVSYNILKNDLDAEECVNDAYLGTWNSIPPTVPASLCAFVCRITRNRSLDRYRAKTAEKRRASGAVSLEEIADILPDDKSVNSQLECERISRLFDRWLKEQSRVNRYIFIRRYWYMDAPEVIARNAGLSLSAVYARIDRMKKRLYLFLTENEVLI